MAPNRLFVDEILSIGLVAAGNNPESSVVIYKSREERREPIAVEAAGVRDPERVAGHGSLTLAGRGTVRRLSGRV